MGINRIIKRNKIQNYGNKAGRSRTESLKIFSAFKKGFLKANSMTPAQIEKLERLDKIQNITGRCGEIILSIQQYLREIGKGKSKNVKSIKKSKT